jgi:recombination protein RecT
MSNALVSLKNEVFAARGAFTAQLSDTSLKFDQEAGFAIQTLENNSFLASTAMKNPQSLRNAVTNTAAIGISLNPAKKQAYLVPRDGRVCLDISYMGLMDLAMATGAILWSQANVVRERDQFALQGLDQKPHHVYSPFDKNRGEVVGVYVVVKTHHGDYLTHAMSVEAVIAIRNRSSAWKSGKTCPWHTDFDEMAKKTCVKQAYKYWPKNARLETAIHHMNTDGGEGLDFAVKPGSAAEFAAEGRQQEADPTLVAELETIAKGRNRDVLAAKWESIGKAGRKAVGATEWERIKSLCEHGEVIEGEAQEIAE